MAVGFLAMVKNEKERRTQQYFDQPATSVRTKQLKSSFHFKTLSSQVNCMPWVHMHDKPLS